jgi:hypothetical protein
MDAKKKQNIAQSTPQMHPKITKNNKNTPPESEFGKVVEKVWICNASGPPEQCFVYTKPRFSLFPRTSRIEPAGHQNPPETEPKSRRKKNALRGAS